MDNLRIFLASRCRKRKLMSEAEAWKRLTRKLDDLKDRDTSDTVTEIALNDTNTSPVSSDSIVNNCIKAFHGASFKSHRECAVVSAESKAICDKAIKDLKHLLSKDLLCKYEFVRDLLSVEVTLPLQLVWQLHTEGILQISTYVFRMIKPGKESLLSSAVIWLLTHSEESSEYVEVATDTLASLLVGSQSGHLNLQLSTICASVLKICTEDVVNLVVNLPQSCPSAESSMHFAYLSSDKLWSCGVEAMEQYVLSHLRHLLNHQCAPNSNQTLMDAVVVQDKTSLDSLAPSFQNLIISIIKGLESEKVINELGVAAVRLTVNWKMIFLIIAALLSEISDCCKNLAKLTDELVELGLQGGRQNELSAGLLLARHCCSCDNKNFGSYSSWFSSHFGPDSVTARNTVQFQSLLQLLTDIVPVDSAENLRVHINKVPQAPTSCHSILHDYTILARTRLADLNESSELAGLFSDSESRQGDIVKVLQHFQRTQEVMKAVIEASIFRRQYYRNVFLVELLGLPGSTEEVFKPENFDLSAEIRHEFILALKSIGKIPDKLFRSYSELKLSQEAINSKIVASRTVESVQEVKHELDQSRRKKSLQVKPKRL